METVKIKYSSIGGPHPSSKLQVIGKIESTGMNAGGCEKVRVRDENGREFVVYERDLERGTK